MFIQDCIKGISNIDQSIAEEITQGGVGIRCNRWIQDRSNSRPSPELTRTILTDAHLDQHLHDYDNFGDQTPFISLSAGAIDRQVALQTNVVHRAEETAALFATDFGRGEGFLFRCWVIVGLNPAVSIEHVAEEVREVHTYTRYSPYLLEGEITAKVHIPANQIESYQLWRVVGSSPPYRFLFDNVVRNPLFDPPSALENRRKIL